MIPKPEMVGPSLLVCRRGGRAGRALGRGLQCAEPRNWYQECRGALCCELPAVMLRIGHGWVCALGTVEARGRLFQFAQDSRSGMVWEWLARVRVRDARGRLARCSAQDRGPLAFATNKAQNNNTFVNAVGWG